MAKNIIYNFKEDLINTFLRPAPHPPPPPFRRPNARSFLCKKNIGESSTVHSYYMPFVGISTFVLYLCTDA